MPLTPEDVHKKTFTPVRLREGYDMGEVDQFLDEVETELTRLQDENDELRRQLQAATDTPAESAPAEAAPAGTAPVVPAPAPEPTAPEPAQPAAEAPTAEAPVAESPASPAESDQSAAAPPVRDVPPLPAVKTVPEASATAARLLEIATNNADQLLNEAKSDADKIVGEARTKAERLETDAKAKVNRLESDAQTRAEKLDAETNERRHQMLGQLNRDKESLTRELEDLRTFEREYRARLRSYFEGQLKALEGEGDGNVPLSPSVSGEETPRRLRELLGDDAG